jgi:predicted unusual protein kinase regulating ubiquinone biosynthesis (AarF/ABC1/UbiB family)
VSVLQLAIELDFRTEVINANKLRTFLVGNKAATVPHIYDKLSTERMIIMEWIEVRPMAAGVRGSALQSSAARVFGRGEDGADGCHL